MKYLSFILAILYSNHSFACEKTVANLVYPDLKYTCDETFYNNLLNTGFVKIVECKNGLIKKNTSSLTNSDDCSVKLPEFLELKRKDIMTQFLSNSFAQLVDKLGDEKIKKSIIQNCAESLKNISVNQEKFTEEYKNKCEKKETN